MTIIDKRSEEEKVEDWMKEGNNSITEVRVGQCALCQKEMTSHESNPTCFGVRICNVCEWKFKRKTLPMPVSKNVGRFYRVYQKFLQGKLYPQIQCRHTAGDGSINITRLKDNTKWFDCEKKIMPPLEKEESV